jgi:hypothetical protein
MIEFLDLLEHLDTNQPIVLLLNAALCIAIMGICVCRLNAMDEHVLLRVRLEYVLCMTTGFVSMARPWWGENVGWASLMLEITILAIFFSSSHAWRPVKTRHGVIDTPPANAMEEPPMELSR